MIASRQVYGYFMAICPRVVIFTIFNEVRYRGRNSRPECGNRAKFSCVKIIANHLFFVLVFLGLLNCGGPVKDKAAETTVTQESESPRRTIRKAMRASVWRFVYCTEEGTDDTELLKFLHDIAAEQPFGKRIEVLNCADLSASDLGAAPLSLFGNRLPAGAEGLPVSKEGTEWRLAPDKAFGGEDVLLLPYYQNPWSGAPGVAGFFLSNDLSELTDRLRAEYDAQPDRMFWPNWAYELHRADGDLVYGAFADTSWKFNPEEELVLSAPGSPVSDDNGLRIFAYYGNVSPAETETVRRALELIRVLSNAALGTQSNFYPEVRLYPNLERIGLRTGSMEPVQYNPAEEVLHIVPSFVSAEDIHLSFEAWRPFILWGTNTRGWEAAVALIQRQTGGKGALPGYHERMNEARQLRGAGLLGMPTQEDPSQLLEEARLRLYAADIVPQGEAELLAKLDLLSRGASLADLATTEPDPAPAAAPPTKMLPPTETLAGMTFAHEGYRIHNGYGGEKIKPSLDSLSKLHVNALAIVPYTFMRDPAKPTTLFIPSGAGQENDWATTCSVREANKRGWFSMLKPQIWIGGGHWPGDVDFDTAAKWDTFFNNYTYWILHYAVMAEREQAGALCLGTELVKTTLKHPDRWREVIGKVRRVYGGQLTYAANWGEEFEGFTFWEDLDAIGLNSYYPLSGKDAPTDEELLAGARRWLRMAAEVSRKTKRPLWLTEVGFRSVDSAWMNPHADGGDRNANGVAQARCFAALNAAAAETPELKGMFIWKWPSYLGRESWRGGGKEFSPGGKPAAEVIGEFNRNWRTE